MNMLHSKKQQHGIALFIVLIFMVLLAMIGLAMVQDGVMQEKMTSNTRNREVAFEAAEIALHHADENIDTITASTFNGSNGLYLITYKAPGETGYDQYIQDIKNDAAVWKNPARWTNCIRLSNGTVSGVAEQPCYRVDKIVTANGTQISYRITARAVGAETNAVVILQAMYKSPEE